MAKLFPALYGNDRLKSILAMDLFIGRSAHAYIIAGPKGSGKHTAVREASAAICCTGEKADNLPFPCGKCRHCVKVSRGVAPDVTVINRGDKATLGVDTIRELKFDLYKAPNEAPTKVYIIDEADTMTVQAQNALLLSLEDPPKFVVFFLITEHPEALLETIRSRAPIIRTELFPASEICKYLTESGTLGTMTPAEKTRLTDAATLSDGTIGRTLELYRASKAEFDKNAAPRALAKEIFSALSTGDQSALIELTQKMPRARDESVNVLMYLLDAVKDGCAAKKGADVPPTFFASAEEVKGAVRNVSFGKLYRIGAAVTDAITDLEKNVSQITVVTSLFLKKYN